MRKRFSHPLFKKKPSYAVGMSVVVLLFLLAILGGFLPILPGFVFLFLGLWLLMHYHKLPWIEKHMLVLQEKYRAWRARRRECKKQKRESRTHEHI